MILFILGALFGGLLVFAWTTFELHRMRTGIEAIRCACGRECTCPTVVLTWKRDGYKTLQLPQCDACYHWLMHGEAYNHPPWSKTVFPDVPN